MLVSKYEIRQASGGDIKELLAVTKEFCSGRFDLDDNEFLYICSFLIFGGGDVFVAIYESQIVGLIACVILPRQTLYKDKIIASEPFWYVDPDHRNSGLGILLLKKYEDWARDLGVHGVQCGSLDKETAKILEAVGYTEVGRTFMKWL